MLVREYDISAINNCNHISLKDGLLFKIPSLFGLIYIYNSCILWGALTHHTTELGNCLSCKAPFMLNTNSTIAYKKYQPVIPKILISNTKIIG